MKKILKGLLISTLVLSTAAFADDNSTKNPPPAVVTAAGNLSLVPSADTLARVKTFFEQATYRALIPNHPNVLFKIPVHTEFSG